jgi:RND family efflux transporter MFP subunit
VPPALPPAAVTVARPVEKEVVDWDEYTGRLQAVETVELRARVGGYLERADFQEGAVVKEGAVLFAIDQAPYKAELDRAQAQVQSASAQSENAATEFTRIERLRAGGGSSEKEFQDAKYAKMKAAADLEAAKAAAENARLNYEWCQVKAPIDGRISRKFVTPGNLITGGTASGTLLTVIERVNPVYCYVDADEASVQKYARLSREKKRVSARDARIPAFLQLLGETGFGHEGVVDFVDNRFDPSTGTLRARGVFANPDGWLLPGMFARVRVPGSGRYRAILVPDAAIDTNQNLKFVRVVGADDVVENRRVTIGSLFGQFRVIESGLSGNERVVINGLQRAIPGTKVAPAEKPFDAASVQTTAPPGSPSTQALPATRNLPATTGPASPADSANAAAAFLNELSNSATRPAATRATTRPAAEGSRQP